MDPRERGVAKQGQSAQGRDRTMDPRGQFLLVSGLLLTLGFMIFATTIVTMNSWEERTHRSQRDLLIDSVDEIVHTLEESLAGMHRAGALNRTEFQHAATIAQTELERNAVRSGLFATIRLAETTDPSFVQKDGRCWGVDWPASENGGVVYGWDHQSLQRSIVGAVYDIHITDGLTSLRTQYYVNLQECAADEITTFIQQWSADLGLLQNQSASYTEEGVMELTEELDWDNLVELEVHPTINQSSIEIHGWNHEQNILALDGNNAEMPSRDWAMGPSGYNHFLFQIDPPERMRPGDSLPNITLEVTGLKERDNDHHKLYLRVYANDLQSEPAIVHHVDLPHGNPETVSVVLDELIEGQDNWTYEDIVESHWNLTVEGIHQHSPNQKWAIDHFNMTGSMLAAQAYRMDITFDWPEIPDIYGDHEIDLHYRVDPATDQEGFLLQLRDRDGGFENGEWWTVHNMTDTTMEADGWRVVHQPIPWSNPSGMPYRMELRVWDTDHQDNWIPEDEDTVQIKLLRMTSHLGGS